MLVDWNTSSQGEEIPPPVGNPFSLNSSCFLQQDSFFRLLGPALPIAELSDFPSLPSILLLLPGLQLTELSSMRHKQKKLPRLPQKLKMIIEHYVCFMEMTLNLPGGEWIETGLEVELTLLPHPSSALDLQIFFYDAVIWTLAYIQWYKQGGWCYYWGWWHG